MNHYFCYVLVLAIIIPNPIWGYLSSGGVNDPYLSDALLREIVNRMGKDLGDVGSDDSYIDPIAANEMPSNYQLMSRASKDLEGEQIDYDTLMDGNNPNPSLRDQEYLQHSSLWGHQYVSGGGGEGPNVATPQIKTDAALPAYCNPPNPCPVGFTEEQGCQMDFENTAAFSRDYQAAQECMCDGEHMFDCSGQDQNNAAQDNSNLDSYLARQFQTSEHKNLVAKKFQPKNPYLAGEKLPVAAKKGNNVY